MNRGGSRHVKLTTDNTYTTRCKTNGSTLKCLHGPISYSKKARRSRSICEMPPRKHNVAVREDKGKKPGPESWDEMRYERPEKLDVPCARETSDGEWFEIERILDTMFIVGSGEPLQHLVQWKPSWSQRVNTQSALQDFHGRAEVLACVAKKDELRSRATREEEWSRQEFLCGKFLVRIKHPDGSFTSQLVPYPDVKRRFPEALFEFFEKRMGHPRVASIHEKRADGLLPVYNQANIPRWLFEKGSVTKGEPGKIIRNETGCSNEGEGNGVAERSVLKELVSSATDVTKTKEEQNSTAEVGVMIENARKVEKRKTSDSETRHNHESQKRARKEKKRGKRRKGRKSVKGTVTSFPMESDQKPLNGISDVSDGESSKLLLQSPSIPVISDSLPQDLIQKSSESTGSDSPKLPQQLPAPVKRSGDIAEDENESVTGRHGRRNSHLNLRSTRINGVRRLSYRNEKVFSKKLNQKRTSDLKENRRAVDHNANTTYTDSNAEERQRKGENVKRVQHSSGDSKSFRTRRSFALRVRNSLENYFARGEAK